MDLKKWGSENITDFSGKIKTEEYVKIHIVLPYLSLHGFDFPKMRFENVMPVQAGTRKITLAIIYMNMVYKKR